MNQHLNKNIQTNSNIVYLGERTQEIALLSQLLLEKNYELLINDQRSKTTQYLENLQFDLILIDFTYFNEVYFEILSTIKKENIFIITFKEPDNNLVKILEAGSSIIIQKPFKAQEVSLQIDKFLEIIVKQKNLQKEKSKIEYTLEGFKELVNLSINIMLLFKDNICIDCNYEAIEHLEYKSKEELIGKAIHEIFTDVSKEHYEELIDNTTDHYFEDQLVSKSGKVYDVQIKERNIKIGHRPLKIIAAIDITDVKRNSKIISQQSKMASMGEMIGNIAHQWRQPLTAISVAAGGIKLNYELDMEDKDETMAELENIVKNTQFLSTTIEDFQNFLKNDRSLSQFFIEDVLSRTLAIIQANIEAQEIEIIQNLELDQQIEGIKNDLIQVFLNIINNAIDILKKQDQNLKRVIVISSKRVDNFLSISIVDSGNGIDDTIIDKIFDPYFTTKHQSQGTGLGLYMTHQIIEKIGGKLSVENSSFMVKDEHFYGAKFTLNIPLSFVN